MFIVDANGWWSQADAARVGAAVDDLDLYLEQPCATLEECAQIRRSSRRPLILDESLFEIADIVRGRAAGAVDALRLKLTRFGGITPVRRARDLAVIFGLAADDRGLGRRRRRDRGGGAPRGLDPAEAPARRLPAERDVGRADRARHARRERVDGRGCRTGRGSGSRSTRRRSAIPCSTVE